MVSANGDQSLTKTLTTAQSFVEDDTDYDCEKYDELLKGATMVAKSTIPSGTILEVKEVLLEYNTDQTATFSGKKREYTSSSSKCLFLFLMFLSSSFSSAFI